MFLLPSCFSASDELSGPSQTTTHETLPAFLITIDLSSANDLIISRSSLERLEKGRL